MSRLSYRRAGNNRKLQEAFEKNVGPIRHCEPPHAAVLHCHSPGVATVARRLRYRYPQQRRRQQRQRVTEGTAMAPWNGPNYVKRHQTSKITIGQVA